MDGSCQSHAMQRKIHPHHVRVLYLHVNRYKHFNLSNIHFFVNGVMMAGGGGYLQVSDVGDVTYQRQIPRACCQFKVHFLFMDLYIFTDSSRARLFVVMMNFGSSRCFLTRCPTFDDFTGRTGGSFRLTVKHVAFKSQYWETNNVLVAFQTIRNKRFLSEFLHVQN